jgi:ketosteroid isomerase-like protein
MHHIKYVEIKKNGVTISKNKYGTQPTDSIFTYTYNIPAEKGDVFEVTATCNLWGHKTSTLVVVVAEPVAEKPAALTEVVVVPKAEEPIATKEPIVAPKAEGPIATKEAVIAPVATDKNLAQVSGNQNETKSIPEEDIRNLVAKWLTSWKSGDMKTYRSCYASDFQSKGMSLNAWISYKANVRKNSKDINISIDHLLISVDENTAKAMFTQSYSSSIFKDSGLKTLELRKINNEWKIFEETM